ncbi:hypothetical protein JXA88_18560, partial [Candidatus Fermentibacteria bacterium]|nr:hypothetical protein [Candidatus Fermentibacteria bacterium]
RSRSSEYEYSEYEYEYEVRMYSQTSAASEQRGAVRFLRVALALGRESGCLISVLMLSRTSHVPGRHGRYVW